MKLNYCFFGSPRFAEIILQELVRAGHPPLALVCNPDRAAGKHRKLTAPLTKQFALAKKLTFPIFQPERPEEIINELRDIKADFFLIAAYAQIISASVFGLPRHASIGVHPSLLPRNRGASPIQQAILSGDSETGVTLYVLDEKTDHGPIISLRSLPIEPNDDYISLETKLALNSASLILDSIPQFISGKITPQEQDHHQATVTKKISTAEAYVLPDKVRDALTKGGQAALDLDRLVRALNPEPGVWTMGTPELVAHKFPDKKRVKILKGFLRNGIFIPRLLQVEGKKPVIVG